MKVLITPRSYGKTDAAVFDMLHEAGLQAVVNDTGGIYDKAAMLERVVDCDGVILGVDPMDAEVISAAKHLKAISKYGVGVDNIDLAAAEARNIKVSRAVGSNSEAVADYAFALMLALSRKVVQIDANCRRGDWRKLTTRDVSHATLGLLGFGAIGKLVAKRAKGFDMRVLAYDPYWDADYAKANGIVRADAEQIFQESDFLSLHLPLLPETKGYVGREQIAAMKSTAVIINTARGGLIDEPAMLEALRSGRIAGAGLDAFAEEPPSDPAWLSLDNVILGSHCAASTEGAARKMGRLATENLIRDLCH